MLTRVQVARRLGKSIATVRRLEGSQLHPRRDASGVLRFDYAEVSRLAAALGIRGAHQSPALVSTSGCGAARSDWFSDRADRGERGSEVDPSDEVERSADKGGGDESCQRSQANEIALLKEQVRELEQRVALAGRDESMAREERRRRGCLVRELLNELESLSDSELRRIQPSQIDAIAELIQDLI